jgi:hypothetical protein
MASLSVHSDRLEIHLTRAERTLALRRDSIVVQRENIRSVIITEDPWIWLRGIRSPGSMIPLVLAAGTWKFHGGKDFVSIKRHRLAVVIDLVDEEFARVILTSQHATDLIDSLKLSTEPTPAGPASTAPTSTEPTSTAPASTEPASTEPTS